MYFNPPNLATIVQTFKWNDTSYFWTSPTFRITKAFPTFPITIPSKQTIQDSTLVDTTSYIRIANWHDRVETHRNYYRYSSKTKCTFSEIETDTICKRSFDSLKKKKKNNFCKLTSASCKNLWNVFKREELIVVEWQFDGNNSNARLHLYSSRRTIRTKEQRTIAKFLWERNGGEDRLRSNRGEIKRYSWRNNRERGEETAESVRRSIGLFLL